MMTQTYTHTFKVESSKYLFKVVNNIATLEILDNPNYQDDKYELHSRLSSFGSSNQVKNPLKVMREWISILNQYLNSVQPSYLYFTAIEKPRRRIYLKMLKYLDDKYVGYPCTNTGKFVIVRKNQ